jgi:hypothetical protein
MTRNQPLIESHVSRQKSKSRAQRTSKNTIQIFEQTESLALKIVLQGGLKALRHKTTLLGTGQSNPEVKGRCNPRNRLKRLKRWKAGAGKKAAEISEAFRELPAEEKAPSLTWPQNTSTRSTRENNGELRSELLWLLCSSLCLKLRKLITMIIPK